MSHALARSLAVILAGLPGCDASNTRFRTWNLNGTQCDWGNRDGLFDAFGGQTLSPAAIVIPAILLAAILALWLIPILTRSTRQRRKP